MEKFSINKRSCCGKIGFKSDELILIEEDIYVDNNNNQLSNNLGRATGHLRSGSKLRSIVLLGTQAFSNLSI